MSSVPAHVWSNKTIKHIMSPSILKFYFDNKIRRQKSDLENASTSQFGFASNSIVLRVRGLGCSV